MEIVHRETCVTFVPKKNETVEHIKFLKSPNECGSNIGYRQKQAESLDVIFDKVCLKMLGAIQHELLHVLGLFHEHSRPDRDQYVDILWDNIDPAFELNFKKGTDEYMETFGLPYDYKSLMHYPKNAFSNNGNYTIISKEDPKMDLGQYDCPTFFDLEKIRRMYNC